MKNVFVVNTPFQLFTVRKIIKQYCHSDENVILSTIPYKTAPDIFHISNNLKGVLRARKLLRSIKKGINDVSFIVPHLGNLFASHFFELSKKYNRPISIYYEGVALFYDPVVVNDKAKKTRTLLGLMMGICYKHHERLYPKELIDMAENCYSPVETKLLSKYNYVKIIDLFDKEEMKACNYILVLTSDVANEDEITECVKSVRSALVSSEQIVYLKPHYALKEESINGFIEHINGIEGVHLEILDKTMPIEALFNSISFGTIICQSFTSAIINMSFIYGKDITVKVVAKETIPQDIIRELNIRIN